MHRLLYTVSAIACLGLAACQPQEVPPAPQTPVTEKEKNFLRLGRNVEKGGDVSSAVDLYKQAMDASTTGVEGHLALSRVYLEQGHRVQARDVLLEGKKRQPSDPEVNLRLGKIAVHRNLPDEAIVYFEDGLKELPGNVDLLNGRGIALDMMGRHEEAQISYRQSLNDGNEPFVENNLAMSYIMTGKYDEAIHILEGIKNIQDSPVMRQNVALAYGLKGDMVKAREWGGKGLNEAEMAENIAFYQEYVKDLDARHDQSVPVPAIPSETISSAPTIPVPAVPVSKTNEPPVEKGLPAETVITPAAPAVVESVPVQKPDALAAEDKPAPMGEPMVKTTPPIIKPEPLPSAQPKAIGGEKAETPEAPAISEPIKPEPEMMPVPAVPMAIPAAVAPVQPVKAPPHWRTLPWMTGDKE